MPLPENRVLTHPVEVLLEEFVLPMGISRVIIAKHLTIPKQRVSEIARGKHGVTPDIAWLLAQAFGTTPELWMNLQLAYDLACSKPKQQMKG